MSDFEEQTITALAHLFAKVETLRQMDIREMLQPERYYCYEDTLQAAYDALTTVEDALTALGMKLEYHHWRLGGAVEELKPLLIHPRSNTEKVMELFAQNMHASDRNVDLA
jgi:spore cortex formation protein SpoVR/YcgB (stage V sporulation)